MRVVVLIAVAMGSWLAADSASAYAQLANAPWPKWQRDLRNSGWTPAVGPDEPRVKWKLEFIGATLQPAATIGHSGEIYVGWQLYAQPFCQMNLGQDTWWRGFLSKISADGQVQSSKPLRDIHASCATLDRPDRIYVVDGHWDFQFSRTHLYAFNRAGMRVWGPRTDPPYSDYTGDFMAIGLDGTIYYPEAASLLAISPEDGSLKWSRPSGADWFYLQCPSVGREGTVYVAHGARSGVQAEVWALDPEDGAIRWAAPHPGTGVTTTGTSLADDGTVYTVFRERYQNVLTAVSPEGQVRWEALLAGWPYFQPSIDSTGRLYLQTFSGDASEAYLESFEPDGSPRWQHRIPGSGGYASNPVVIDGHDNLHVIVPDHYVTDITRLMSYAPDGVLRWDYSFAEGSPYQAPVMGPDGTIYAMIDEVEGDGIMHLYAFGPGEAPDPAWVGRQ